MNVLMISGDRSILQGKKGAFWYMLEEFVQYWDQVDIICPKCGNAEIRKYHNPFERVFLHPSPRGLWYQPRWIVKKGRELIGMYRHDIMTVHEYPPFYNGFGAEWLSRLTGVPYVMEIHHIIGHPIASSLTEWVGRELSRLILVNDTYGAKAVRCVSRGVAKVLQEWGTRKDSIFIMPSFYLDGEKLKFDASIRKQYDIVCAGRLVANKGLPTVLRALVNLPKTTLLIVGDGPRRRKLERLVHSLGIGGRVTFAGWLPESTDVYRAIQSAHIFVMNSRSEGGPRIALEAMALGMPVLSTKIGVMPEVISDNMNGMFTTGTEADLAKKIETLLSYPSLADRLGNEARKICQKFEKKKLIREYADFLKEFARHS